MSSVAARAAAPRCGRADGSLAIRLTSLRRRSDFRMNGGGRSALPITTTRRKRMPTVIDVHTHMLSEEWIRLIAEHGAPRYAVKPSKDGPRAIMWDGAPFMTPQEGHLDYEKRIT